MHYSKINKQCRQCSNPLTLNNTRDIERKNFCSRSCRQKWRYDHGDSPFLDDAVRKLSLTPENIKKRNLPKGPRKCDHCHITFMPDGARQKFCTTCVPDKSSRTILRRYGISNPEWEAIYDSQGGKCALCDNQPYAVDHCHTHGHIRGLLCDNCNRLLGKIETAEWEQWYQRAKGYLSR